LEAVKKFDVVYDHTEHVGSADFERVLREYAERGYNLIFVDAYGHEEMARRVAKDYPKIAFMGASDLGPVEPNFAVFTAWIHEPTYLCGIIAGKLTKTNKIGVVAGIPIPVINIPVNAFIEGAKEANPKVKVLVSYIGSFFDPPKAKEAAIAQIESGVDYIFADRYGVIEAAKGKGVLAFGNMVDQNSIAPDTVITGPVWDMWPTVNKVVPDVKNNKFVAMDYREWTMMAKGGASLAPYHGFEKKLPVETKKMVERKVQEIKSGVYRVPVISTTAKTD
jgi:basic membrane lipoprotein Med (substrate-binding protein (PBP1-ABC) superfamily)